VAEPLDDYIDAVANLAVTLKMAGMVDEFPLPDETEPASIYAA
jgi:hypothetical protein